ncbi:MAG: hypothetical protein HY760_03865 [Nitrospirae bacterium]|nr:hypothetical protein [Nitrospirota bacterium]
MTRILKAAALRWGLAALPILCILAFPVGASGSEENVTIYGVIGDVRASERHLVVNEERIGITEETEYFNHKEKAISIQDLKTGKWIFGIGRPTATGGLTLEKVYLLPRPLKGKDQSSYPFMNRDENVEDAPSKNHDRER